MALTRKAKMLTKEQIDHVVYWLGTTRRNPLRDTTVFYLSMYAGMRAKEIASLSWAMVTDSSGCLSDSIELTNAASKGSQGGRIIPMAPALRDCLVQLLAHRRRGETQVVLSDDRKPLLPKSVAVMFGRWYETLGFEGCSSHSGRRTFITQAARRIGSCGGSLREVQDLAGHASLWQTQQYIVVNEAAKRSVVTNLWED